MVCHRFGPILVALRPAPQELESRTSGEPLRQPLRLGLLRGVQSKGDVRRFFDGFSMKLRCLASER